MLNHQILAWNGLPARLSLHGIVSHSTRLFATTFSTALACVCFTWPGICTELRAAQPNEAAYLYLGDYPANANPGWHENAQGLAHDDRYWYITQERRLWKIPVGNDLCCVNGPDVHSVGLTPAELPELWNSGCNHLGDSECFRYGGEWYVVVPLEPNGAIGIFRARTLEYISRHQLTGQGDTAPWCAVDPQGHVYSSNFSNVSVVHQYTVDWNVLVTPGAVTSLSAPVSISLLDEAGNPPNLQHVQGGVVSPSGGLLFLVADGIHVFDTATWRRIQQSTNGSGYFDYEFHPDYPLLEEPEGLTYWDLCDGGVSPHVAGQLHVLMVDNDITNADEIYVKHYTDTIHVDGRYGGEEHGTPSQPFNTVNEANRFSWNRARILIEAGAYDERVTFTKRLTVAAHGGTVSIGG